MSPPFENCLRNICMISLVSFIGWSFYMCESLLFENCLKISCLTLPVFDTCFLYEKDLAIVVKCEYLILMKYLNWKHVIMKSFKWLSMLYMFEQSKCLSRMDLFSKWNFVWKDHIWAVGSCLTNLIICLGFQIDYTEPLNIICKLPRESERRIDCNGPEYLRGVDRLD